MEEVIPPQKGTSNVLDSYPSNLGGNCVTFARSRAHVPMGVSTLKQKIDKIRTHEPYIGAVGVTAESNWGHLVIITEIKNDLLIIEEGNYKHGYVTRRAVPTSLVIGYL